MNIYSPWVIPAALLIALGTTNLLSQSWEIQTHSSRYYSIDGLRGCLALFVFVHHGSIWFVQLRQDVWQAPNSNLFRHLGESSVALFFMITAFLFAVKVMDRKSNPIDWMTLYVSRVMRLFPIYLFAVILMWLMALTITGWALLASPIQLLKQLLGWLTFTIIGAPAINGLKDAGLLLAGVTWSLPYEWWFYLCLPLLGLFTGKRQSRGWAVFAAINLVLFQLFWHLDWHRIQPFLGGIAAALAVRNDTLCAWARRRGTGLVVVVCLASAVAWSPTAYDIGSVLLLSVAFILIACGNDLFSALSANAMRLLGEMTYSIYLLHGLLMSLVFRWVIGLQEAAGMSVGQHWALVLGLTVPLIFFSFATYRLIEVPAQRAGLKIVKMLQRNSSLAFKTRPTAPEFSEKTSKQV
jgi:peptidoglycan/LPS O-acetylase OafA/YrhL